MSIELVRDNFQEICHAAGPSREGGIHLVANFSGTRIYDSRVGWGRLWRWFYDIAEAITGKDYRFIKFKCAVLRTHHLFHIALQHLSKHLGSYDAYMKQVGSGYDVRENEVHHSRQAITLCYRSFFPFIKLLRGKPNPKLMKIFQACFPHKKQSKEMLGLWLTPDINKLEAAQKIIALEGISQGPLPLEIFKKIIRGKTLNVLDNKSLDVWIKKVNSHVSSVDKVHGAMKEIAVGYKKASDVGLDIAALLETYLSDRGCRVFDAKDPNYLQWRKRLKAGDIITYKGEDMTLGRRINALAEGVGDLMSFEVAGEAGRMVLVAQNRAALLIRKYRQEEAGGFGVEPVELLDVFAEGRYGLIEKVEPITWRKWVGIGHEGDRRLLDEVVTLLQWFVNQDATPSGFAASKLVLDGNFCLRSLVPMKKKAFDFNDLEDFVMQFANGNQSIFQYVMAKSGLLKHKTALFYRELVTGALKGQKMQADDLAAIYKIVDFKIVNRGVELVKHVLRMHQDLCWRVSQMQFENDSNEVEDKVRAAILQAYKETKACGVLWPSMSEDVFKRL